jgi:hypothetical protein
MTSSKYQERLYLKGAGSDRQNIALLKTLFISCILCCRIICCICFAGFFSVLISDVLLMHSEKEKGVMQ